jgi:hypothetical protein
MNKFLKLASMLILMSASLFAQTSYDFDVRSGIKLNFNENTSTQTNFVKEVYFNVNSKVTEKIDANASIWYNGSTLDLYTANLKYTASFSKSKLSFKLGAFENDYYVLASSLWKNNFLSSTLSKSYFSKTGTGLEVKASSKYFDLAVSTLGTVNHDTLDLKANKFLANLTVRPTENLTFGGYFYTVGNVDSNTNFSEKSIQYIGAIVDYDKTFSKMSLNVGSELFYDLKDSSTIALNSWAEVSHAKVFNGKVSLLGNLTYTKYRNGSNNYAKMVSVSVICHPVEKVKLGLSFSNERGFANMNGISNSMNTVGLFTQIKF